MGPSPERNGQALNYSTQRNHDDTSAEAEENDTPSAAKSDLHATSVGSNNLIEMTAQTFTTNQSNPEVDAGETTANPEEAETTEQPNDSDRSSDEDHCMSDFP